MRGKRNSQGSGRMVGRFAKTIASFIEELSFNGLEAFGKYYSSYRAFVYSNEDPDNCNRLRLIIPAVAGNEVYDTWAYPKNNFAGNNYGIQMLPRKGDMVWVTFEGGNPELPLWEHGHFALKEKPSKGDLKDLNSYWFVTPNGNSVKINDTKNTIHIETKNGDYVEINPSSVSLVTTKAISLGSLDKSKYKSVLGQELVTLLKELSDILKDGKIMTSMGPQKFLPDTQSKLAIWKNKLNKILSKLVTLE